MPLSLRSFILPEREAHGGVLVEVREATAGGMAIRYGARVQSPLERYRARSQITERQYRAGQRLYASWALGVIGAHNGEAGCGAATPAGMTDAQIAAVFDYCKAMDRIGGRLAMVVHTIVCDEVGASDLARETGKHTNGIMELLRCALSMLADAWDFPVD
jgi:ribosomal protein S5